MAYIIVVAIFVFSFLVGNGSVCLLRISKSTLFEKCTIGLCSMVLISTSVFLIGIPKPNRYYVLLTLYSILIVIGLWKSRIFDISRKTSKKGVKLVVSLLIVTLFYSLGYSGDVKAESIRQRVGPDLLGWISSAQYIAKENSLDPLKNWLEAEFPNSTEKSPFSRENIGTRDSIYYTASYTKQIQSEFLIGANRLGVPCFLGLNFLPMSGTYQWAKSYLALSAFFQFLILLWLLEKLNFLYKRKDRLFFACSAGFLLCSYQILFPIFEGSFGQHFSFLLFCLLLNRWRNPNLFFWMFVLFSIVFVYKDLILISIPFIASAIVSQEGHQLYSRFQKRPFFWLISISILVTTLFFFGGFSKRLSTLSLGGWNEGVLPSVLDVFGILGAYTWEKQGISSLWFSTLSILLTLIAFVLVVRICKFSKKESLALTVVYLSFLFYSLVSVLNENNYVLWKTLPYYSIWTTWFILIRASNFKLDYIKMFLVLQIAMAIVFFQKWIQNSTRIEIYSLNENEIIKVNNLVDTFALDFREQKYLNVWALMGDMNWGIDTRQVRNQVSEMSDRRKVFVIPSQICRNAPDKEQVLIELKDSCIVRDPDDLSQKIP